MPTDTATLEMPSEVVEAVGKTEEAALTAIHDFVNSLNEAVPTLLPHSGDSRAPDRQKVIDAGFGMVENALAAQVDFMQHLIGSAASMLTRAGSEAGEQS